MSIERSGPVIESEKSGIAQMIHLFCEKKHQTPKGVLCDECQELLAYAHERLEHCRFGEERPTCRKCPVHCYRPAMRESEGRHAVQWSPVLLPCTDEMDTARDTG